MPYTTYYKGTSETKTDSLRQILINDFNLTSPIVTASPSLTMLGPITPSQQVHSHSAATSDEEMAKMLERAKLLSLKKQAFSPSLTMLGPTSTRQQ